ncbi:MAG: trypsin-like peptidase domain-containing protein [Holophagaceae bacterium]|nr:trypsin-like peptidase domain-containing protein [Holophagaceae bacterium]
MHWHEAYEKVLPHILRIETPDGAGTGFLFGYNADRSLAAIATAAHVVDRAHAWKQPIKIIHHTSGQEVFLQGHERVVFLDRKRDSASILVPTGTLPLPESPLPLMDVKQIKKVGVVLAWVGFPSVAYPELCFFTGSVSAFLFNDDCYLIDGVAINGVSGGPVFDALTGNQPELVGSISAYISNRVGGASLPGLLRAQDITSFHEALQTVRSLDEARKMEEEQSKDQPPSVSPEN